MSRYIVSTLLAIAAAFISATDFAVLGEQADGVWAALALAP